MVNPITHGVIGLLLGDTQGLLPIGGFDLGGEDDLTPVVAFVAVVGLLLVVGRLSGKETPRGREVLASFWEEPEAARGPAEAKPQ